MEHAFLCSLPAQEEVCLTHKLVDASALEVLFGILLCIYALSVVSYNSTTQKLKDVSTALQKLLYFIKDTAFNAQRTHSMMSLKDSV